MQSILSTSPTKLLATENSSADKEANVEDRIDQTGEESTVQRFSSVLNDFTDNTPLIKSPLLQEAQQKTTSDKVLEQDLIEETKEHTNDDQLEENILSIVLPEVAASKEQELVIDNNNNKMANSKTELSSTKEISSGFFSPAEAQKQKIAQDVNKELTPDIEIADNELTEDSLKELGLTSEFLVKEEVGPAIELFSEEVLGTTHHEGNNTSVLFNESTEATDVQVQPLANAINPILSQIESAQKMDTQVTDPQVKLTVLGKDITLKTAKENATSFEKDVKFNTDNITSDTAQVIDEPSLKESAQSSNKIDNLISSLNQEMAKSTPPQNIDSNGLRSITATAASDRSLQQTTHNTPFMQSAALQQPIELQSKHASSMIGDRLMMMIAQGKQEVTIRLDPAELGSMHIKLQIQQDQLQVAIHTQVGQSRDIVEQNLPRLREQLAQQGINLGEATVEQQSKQEQSSSQHSRDGGLAIEGGREGTEQGLDDSSEWISTQIPIPAQGIDYYA